MKKILIVCALTLPCLAQVYTPPSAPAGGAAKPADSGGDTTINRPAQESAAPLVGNEVPFVDPSAETVTFNGKNFAISDNRLFAARFERYLNEPEDNSAAAMEYRKVINDILDLISPHNPKGPQLYPAFKLLPKGSSFPGDSRLCDSLAQAIYVAMVSAAAVLPMAKTAKPGVKEAAAAAVLLQPEAINPDSERLRQRIPVAARSPCAIPI